MKTGVVFAIAVGCLCAVGTIFQGRKLLPWQALSQARPLASSDTVGTLRVGVVDFDRLIATYAPIRAAEAKLNAEWWVCHRELEKLKEKDTVAAKTFAGSREREIQAEAVQVRSEVLAKLQDCIRKLALQHHLDLVFNSSGQADKGMYVVLGRSLNVVDLTEEIAHSDPPDPSNHTLQPTAGAGELHVELWPSPPPLQRLSLGR